MSFMFDINPDLIIKVRGSDEEFRGTPWADYDFELTFDRSGRADLEAFRKNTTDRYGNQQGLQFSAEAFRKKCKGWTRFKDQNGKVIDYNGDNVEIMVELQATFCSLCVDSAHRQSQEEADKSDKIVAKTQSD